MSKKNELSKWAKIMGKLGGQKGGIARAQSLSPERLSEIARKAARARWNSDPSDVPGKGVPKPFEGGFEDDDEQPAVGCRHPSHEPPSHMVIPAGKRYRHICPACGYTVVIRSNSVIC